MTKQMMVLIVIIAYFLVRAIFIEPNALEVTKYNVKCAELAGVRAVFLTDFHLKRYDFKRLDKIVKLTQEQHPDVVFLGGDFIKGKTLSSSMDVNVAAQKLRLINVPMYAVLGNHDWWAGGREIAKILQKNRIVVLENANTRAFIKRRYIDIIGLADMTTRNINIPKAMKKTARPRILLTHNPDIYYDIVDRVTLILAGHTHGGQVVFPLAPPLFVPSKYGSVFASGLIKKTNNSMIISKGLGTSVVPMRLNCKPEIVVIDFTK